MICLFISDGCSSCKELIKDIPVEWASQIITLHVEFDRESKKYRIYKDGKTVGNESPVQTVPTLCFFESKEVYSGYSEIIERLKNDSR